MTREEELQGLLNLRDRSIQFLQGEVHRLKVQAREIAADRDRFMGQLSADARAYEETIKKLRVEIAKLTVRDR